MEKPKPNSHNEYTAKEAILLARKYNLETEIRQELSAGLSPNEALEEWDLITPEEYSLFD